MEKIIILDFGSQYTQLIARRIRELNTYCEILPYNKFPFGDPDIKGVILSGSPFSVNDANAFNQICRKSEATIRCSASATVRSIWRKLAAVLWVQVPPASMAAPTSPSWKKTTCC